MSEGKKRGNPFIGTTISGGRNELLSVMHLLPKEVQAALQSGSLTLVDEALYSVKRTNFASTVELMQSSDTQLENITNLNNRKLEAGQYMLLTGIRVLAASISGETAPAQVSAYAATAFFQDLSSYNFLANSELDIVVAGKTLFPRNSCQMFRRNNNENNSLGYYRLACPKLIVPQAEIIPTLRMNAAAAGQADYLVRLELCGVKTVRG